VSAGHPEGERRRGKWEGRGEKSKKVKKGKSEKE
jgi:hypothetical protein